MGDNIFHLIPRNPQYVPPLPTHGEALSVLARYILDPNELAAETGEPMTILMGRGRWTGSPVRSATRPFRTAGGMRAWTRRRLRTSPTSRPACPVAAGGR